MAPAKSAHDSERMCGVAVAGDGIHELIAKEDSDAGAPIILLLPRWMGPDPSLAHPSLRFAIASAMVSSVDRILYSFLQWP